MMETQRKLEDRSGQQSFSGGRRGRVSTKDSRESS